MIDFIKAYTNDKLIAGRLRNTICTQVEVDHTTGEISIGEYFGKCSQFIINVYPSGRIQFKGSLHKYYNNGMNNSDFNLTQVRQTIHSFCELIGVKSENIFLENVEFGANINLPYPPSVILNNIISLSCGKIFSEMAGEGSNCKLGEYRHKIYNKSSQYNTKDSLLRYEIHVDKMRWIYPVKTLQDLMKIEIWDFLQERLVKQFQQIVFTEIYNIHSFKKWERNYYEENNQKINNSRYWKKISPLERHRALKWVRKIQLKGQHKYSETISNLIYNKVDELKNVQVFHHSNTG